MSFEEFEMAAEGGLEDASVSVAHGQVMPYDILTPSQAAAYLQVGEDVVVREAEAGHLPGQKIGGEWRFLRLAIAEWLRAGREPAPKLKSSKERMLSAYGAWKEFGEDPEEVIAELYRARKTTAVKKR